MKKFFGLFLGIAMVIMCIVPVVAADDEQHPVGGVIFESWNDLINDKEESTLRAIATNRKGDINRDGSISAVDARKCLRAVAGLEKDFDFMQENVADINGDGEVSAVDARMILQMVAGTKTVDTVAETIMGDGVVIGPLLYSEGTAYYWQYEVDKDGLTVLERDFDDDLSPDAIGGKVRKYFAFTPEIKGTYRINFKLANVNQTEIVDEFNCILTVK